jgi:hypothetical protein
MLRPATRTAAISLVGVGLWLIVPFTVEEAKAVDGKRDHIRYQQPQDIFYNHYVGPGPGGVPAKMYPSPLPVPAHVGHHYHTYPPLYPHEFMYHHTRAWYTYHPGAGWTRTKAYYHPGGGLWDVLSHMKRF